MFDNLLCKQISLVEKQYHGCLTEPLAVTDLVEESERFNHAVLSLILEEGEGEGE